MGMFQECSRIPESMCWIGNRPYVLKPRIHKPIFRAPNASLSVLNSGNEQHAVTSTLPEFGEPIPLVKYEVTQTQTLRNEGDLKASVDVHTCE